MTDKIFDRITFCVLSFFIFIGVFFFGTLLYAYLTDSGVKPHSPCQQAEHVSRPLTTDERMQLILELAQQVEREEGK